MERKPKINMLKVFPEIFKRTNRKIKPPILSESLYWAVFYAFLMLKCFYFHFTTRLNLRPLNFSTDILMLTSTLGTLMLISSLIVLAFKKHRPEALLVINIILSFVLFADTIYYRYYYTSLSVPVLFQIGLVDSIGDSIVSLLKPKDIIYALDIPFMLAGLYMMKQTGYNTVRFSRRALASLFLIVFGLAPITITYKNSDTSLFYYDNNYVIKSLGIHYFHLRDTAKFIKDNYLTDRRATDDEINAVNEFFSSKQKGGNKLYGIAKGKNLLVIQVEALQQFVINKRLPDGKEITPNLNKLLNDSLYFNNFYYQTAGGNTSDAELLCNTSLYPVKEGSVFIRYPSNSFYSLPKYLKQQGYATYVSHANNPSFWNRSAVYKSFGFDRFFSNNDFTLDEYIGWGLGDISFYRQSLDKIDTSKPFYGMFISLSSHYPYKYEYFENYDFDVGDLEGTFLGYYLKAVNYADKALGTLIEELKNRGLYDSTLLAIYGDHSAVPKEYSNELIDFLKVDDDSFEWMKLQKVPLIIRYPGIDKGSIVSTTGGEIDLLPTIANLMGFEVQYAIGKDLLNCPKGYAVLRNGSVITDKYIYLSNKNEAYDVATGRVIEEADYKQEVESLQYELIISDIIIHKDILK
jgi:lipoteichoic acid synthase